MSRFATVPRMLTLVPQLNKPFLKIAQDENVSLPDLEAATVKRIAGTRVTYAQEPGQFDQPMPTYDNSRIEKDTGFQCDYNTDRAVGAYLDWLRDETYS